MHETRTVHTCVGEAHPPRLFWFAFAVLSTRVWGKQRRSAERLRGIGTVHTCVGEAIGSSSFPRPARYCPHVCGGSDTAKLLLLRKTVLSTRVWWKLL